MNWWKSDCDNVVLDGKFPINLPPQASCFALWLAFANATVLQLQRLNPYLQWNGALRVGLYGFWCANLQTTPQYRAYTQLTDNYTEFLAAYNDAFFDIADGGTCPGAALQQVYTTIAMSNPRPYAWSALVTLTDGVFYDMPWCVSLSLGVPTRSRGAAD